MIKPQFTDIDQEQVLGLGKKYAAIVRQELNTRSIILYGSHAKGTSKESHDIDIAVIVDEIPCDNLDSSALFWRLSRKIHTDIRLCLKIETMMDF